MKAAVEIKFYNLIEICILDSSINSRLLWLAFTRDFFPRDFPCYKGLQIIT